MQKALWVRYASVRLLIKDQDYSYCILTDASCEGKVFPVLCQCGSAGSWHSSFLSTLSCRMNSVFPMPSCSLSVFNVSCSLGAQWNLTGAFNLHPTDDRQVHTSVYTASVDTFCKVFISSVHSFIRCPYWFLSNFFIVMCEMMNPLWIIHVGSMSYKYCFHIYALHCLNGILWHIKSHNFNSMM